VTNRKRKTINYLVACAVILLIINTAIDNKEKPPKEKIVNELSVLQIEKVFFKVLDDYGIESNWITHKKYKTSDFDSAKVEYFVKLPQDLPVPLIIKEINQVIEKDITGFVSDEKKMYGTTEIRIYTNEVLKLKATLIPDKANIRNRSDLSFIVSDACELGEKDFKQFLSTYFPVAALIIPDKDNFAAMDSLKSYTKEYSVLISDDIDDKEMKLNPEYSKTLLHGSILNIVNKFESNRAYIIDDNSKIFNSTRYRYVKNDFRDQGAVLHPRSELINMDISEDTELISKFKTQCSDTLGTKQKIFLIPYDNFLKLADLIEKYKKRGNKIIPLSMTYLFRKPEK
jgi:hypothetical protein